MVDDVVDDLVEYVVEGRLENKLYDVLDIGVNVMAEMSLWMHWCTTPF